MTHLSSDCIDDLMVHLFRSITVLDERDFTALADGILLIMMREVDSAVRQERQRLCKAVRSQMSMQN